MTKQKFQLIAGVFYQRKDDSNGESVIGRHDRHIMHKKGAVIESDEPLDLLYVNKFSKIIDAPIVETSPERKAAVQTLIEGGQWTDGDRAFLESLTDDGFGKILRVSNASTSTLPDPKMVEKKESPLGDDVTENFPRAVQAELCVFANSAGKHQVTKPNSTSKPLNSAPMDANKVEAFIDKYVKESR